MELRGKFNSADQLDAGSICEWNRLVIAGERIVISNAKRPDAGPQGFFDQFRRRRGAVRFMRM